MSEISKPNEALSETEAILRARIYLEKYSVFRKILEQAEKGKHHFGNPRVRGDIQNSDGNKGDVLSEAKIKMFEIKRFIISLPASDEKVFLFLRYIHGETLEGCGERMNISSRQVFRLQKSALLMAHDRLFCQNSTDTKCIE